MRLFDLLTGAQTEGSDKSRTSLNAGKQVNETQREQDDIRYQIGTCFFELFFNYTSYLIN